LLRSYVDVLCELIFTAYDFGCPRENLATESAGIRAQILELV
jgi:hypothetical protein